MDSQYDPFFNSSPVIVPRYCDNCGFLEVEGDFTRYCNVCQPTVTETVEGDSNLFTNPLADPMNYDAVCNDTLMEDLPTSDESSYGSPETANSYSSPSSVGDFSATESVPTLTWPKPIPQPVPSIPLGASSNPTGTLSTSCVAPSLIFGPPITHQYAQYDQNSAPGATNWVDSQMNDLMPAQQLEQEPVGTLWNPITIDEGTQIAPEYTHQHQHQHQRQHTPSGSSTSSGASGKSPRKVKAFSCENCRKSKTKCDRDGENGGACSRCAKKGVQCTTTGVDRRTNKTNQEELQSTIDKFNYLSTGIFCVLRNPKMLARVGHPELSDQCEQDDTPAPVPHFPTLASPPSSRGRLRDVRDSKKAVEGSGHELMGSLFSLCGSAVAGKLTTSQIEEYIKQIEDRTFDPASIGIEKEYLKDLGQVLEKSLSE